MNKWTDPFDRKNEWSYSRLEQQFFFFLLRMYKHVDLFTDGTDVLINRDITVDNINNITICTMYSVNSIPADIFNKYNL